MESLLLGFEETLTEGTVDKSRSYKLVPWISWDEWKLVKKSLFSSSSAEIAFSLRRISTWRSRGCIPEVIEITASIVEIRQKDPLHRKDLNGNVWPSEEMLAMLYSMAIVRLVNGLVEKTRNKNQISIGEAADAIGIPRMLIDVRHEASHRDLPSLQLVRLASEKAVDWLISYYWEPQEKAIPVQNNQPENLRKEIQSKLQGVANCLKAKQILKTSFSRSKEKRVRQMNSKFLILAAGKSSVSSGTGSKMKKLSKSLKSVLRLCYLFSPEVVGVLLEFLLNEIDSSSSADLSEDPKTILTTKNKINNHDDWKTVALELSKKEPKFLMALIQAVLEKMEVHKVLNYESSEPQPSENLINYHRTDLLSCLLKWLVGNLKILSSGKEKGTSNSNGLMTMKHHPMINGLLRRCLLVSSPGNKQLMASALILAHLIGSDTLLRRLKKLSSLWLSDQEENYVLSCNGICLTQQEEFIQQAEERFKLIKLHRNMGKNLKLEANSLKPNCRWTVAKSWNSCPIGMVSLPTGFSVCLPILDYPDECIEAVKLVNIQECGPNQYGKREAEIDILELDGSCVKKSKGIEDNSQHISSEDFTEPLTDDGRKKKGTEDDTNHSEPKDFIGHLMIDGMWKEVNKKELLAITSDVRLLV